MSDTGMCWDTCPNRAVVAALGPAAPLATRAQVVRTLLWMLASGAQSSLPALLEQAFDAGFGVGSVYERQRLEAAVPA